MFYLVRALRVNPGALLIVLSSVPVIGSRLACRVVNLTERSRSGAVASSLASIWLQRGDAETSRIATVGFDRTHVEAQELNGGRSRS